MCYIVLKFKLFEVIFLHGLVLKPVSIFNVMSELYHGTISPCATVCGLNNCSANGCECRHPYDRRIVCFFFSIIFFKRKLVFGITIFSTFILAVNGFVCRFFFRLQRDKTPIKQTNIPMCENAIIRSKLKRFSIVK